MKVALFFVFALVALATAEKAYDFSMIDNIKENHAIEATVAKWLLGFNREEFIVHYSGEAYNIIRSGVGCMAGVFDGANIGFMLAQIITDDPTDIMSYVFVGLFVVAWWGQNGQALEYYCGYFWNHIV
mmetsp:Transcript_13079/g.24065  ORF Transcript_13079/g.24065 Transcript_13079/m.24065 type:complete len:128 (-) Transcript_13079:38-421(-)